MKTLIYFFHSEVTCYQYADIVIYKAVYVNVIGQDIRPTPSSFLNIDRYTLYIRACTFIYTSCSSALRTTKAKIYHNRHYSSHINSLKRSLLFMFKFSHEFGTIMLHHTHVY